MSRIFASQRSAGQQDNSCSGTWLFWDVTCRAMGLLLESGRMKLTMRMMRLLMMVIMRLLMMVMVRLMMMVMLMMMMMTMTRHELFDAEERAGNIDGLVFVCMLLLLLLVASDLVTFVIRSVPVIYLGFIPLIIPTIWKVSQVSLSTRSIIPFGSIFSLFRFTAIRWISLKELEVK